VIEALLESEVAEGTRRKQRLTAKRIFLLLREQHGYEGSETSVRRAVRDVREQLGMAQREAFVPLEYEPGVDGQVDFFEADVRIAGEVKTMTFLLVRACYSSRQWVGMVPAENQEGLFEGLMVAFQHFGGVFHDLWFDNLTLAVAKVLRGRAREVQRRFDFFRMHYAFDAEFCGPAKGNEKGGVEGGVKFVRRNALSPVLEVDSADAVNRHLITWMKADDERLVTGHGQTVNELWQAETGRLIPLPTYAFDAGRPVSRKVSAYGLVSFDTNLYSAPVEWVGATVMAKCYSERVEIHARIGLVAEHRRLYGKRQTSFQLEHYLPLLDWKTRAFDRAAPVRAARAQWPPAYELLLRVMRQRLGEVEGTRSFIQVLWLHKFHPVDRVHKAVRFVVTHAEPTYAGVLARLERDKPEAPAEHIAEKLRHLPAVRVDRGDVAAYDRLRRGGK
jgi:transposase